MPQVAGGSVTYTNVITFAASPASAVITRRKSLQLVVRCEMERNSTVEMMYLTEEDVIHDQSALGKYNTTMALFESSAFEKPLLQSPYFVDLNQNIFAQVSLHTADPNLVVFLDTCSASPTHDFVSPTYDLIRSGCVRCGCSLPGVTPTGDTFRVHIQGGQKEAPSRECVKVYS